VAVHRPALAADLLIKHGRGLHQVTRHGVQIQIAVGLDLDTEGAGERHPDGVGVGAGSDYPVILQFAATPVIDQVDAAVDFVVANLSVGQFHPIQPRGRLARQGGDACDERIRVGANEVHRHTSAIA